MFGPLPPTSPCCLTRAPCPNGGGVEFLTGCRQHSRVSRDRRRGVSAATNERRRRPYVALHVLLPRSPRGRRSAAAGVAWSQRRVSWLLPVAAAAAAAGENQDAAVYHDVNNRNASAMLSLFEQVRERQNDRREAASRDLTCDCRSETPLCGRLDCVRLYVCLLVCERVRACFAPLALAGDRACAPLRQPCPGCACLQPRRGPPLPRRLPRLCVHRRQPRRA
jgi:hypothetical protein